MTTREPTPAKQRLSLPSARQKLLQAAPFVGVIVAAGALAYLGWLFLSQPQTDPFSNLEQTFFGVYTLFVGAAISWLTTEYYSRRQSNEAFQQLARPALRRVLAARDSTDGLLSAIDARHRRLKDPIALESLRSLRELVEQHARSLDDAILDWRELLPTEVEQVQQVSDEHRRNELAVDDMRVRIESLEQVSTPDAAVVDALKSELAALRSEIRERASSRSSVIGSGILGSGHYSYTPGVITGTLKVDDI